MARLRISLSEEEKHSLLKVKVDKSFRARSRVTKRTIAVAKAFGIGIDEEKVFPVFEDFEVEVNPGDVVYVTGESGAGKSVLLKALARELSRHSEFGGVVTDRDVEVKPGEILIHGVGRDESEAMRILSMVGLNEAFLFLRRYRDLSEGQKYRYRLAKAYWTGRKTLIFDEFCSTLDRVTARIVAYLSQKFCRKTGRTLIAATAHEDLLEDLNPNLLIRKSFGPYVEVAKLNPKPRPCSILKNVEIEEGSYADYKALAPFHYIGKTVGYVRKIFKAVAAVDGRRELAGVIVYSHPYLDVSARSKIIPKLRELRRKLGKKRYAKWVDENFSRIARVIVHPKYRGIGLGSMLVRETLPRAGTRFVEALAVMARYNPFFEKAGMLHVAYESEARKKTLRELEKLEALGINLDLLSSRSYLLKSLKKLRRRDLRKASEAAARIAELKLRTRRTIERIRSLDVEAIADLLSSLRADPEYFIWPNPERAHKTESEAHFQPTLCKIKTLD